MARQRRRDEVTRQQPRVRRPRPPRRGDNSLADTVRLLLDEGLWHAKQWQLGRGAAVVAAVIVGLYLLTLLVSGRIYPNVVVMDVNIGRMTGAQAAAALRAAWLEDVRITVTADGQTIDTLTPQQLGLTLDDGATVEAAQALSFRLGLVRTPVQPVVGLPDAGYLAAQEYLLNAAEQINTAAVSATFRWEGDTLVGVDGTTGRLLDIAPTLAALRENPAAVVEAGAWNVQVSPVLPDVVDPTLYMADAEAFTREPFSMKGYDPFRDETVTWAADRDTVTGWLEASPNGLTLREETFAPYIDAQIAAINPEGEETRYLNVEETMGKLRAAIEGGTPRVMLRLRYRPQPYTVVAGDTASKIARKTGIPFYMLEQQNPGRDLDVLSIGDTLEMPTRDVTMPNDPVPNKRIVVNLNEQELWAFENGELVFNWLISSGQSAAPTSPGIYQILSHADTASGSSFTLCDDMGCGQWEMYWFMGVYEVVPGLMNGFHGAVLLPNGAYLNGGATGYPSTFGCVMSQNEQAQQLYNWAEVGTVVEIVSDEFQPLSSLAQSTEALSS